MKNIINIDLSNLNRNKVVDLKLTFESYISLEEKILMIIWNLEI